LTTPSPSPLTLYDLCVQNAPAAVRFIDAARRNLRLPRAMSLREDFSGGGGLALAWVASHKSRTAVAVDHNAAVLARLAHRPRLTPIAASVLRCHRRADVIAATNFPLGYFHTRAALLQYLTLTRKRLQPGGTFIADMYGGPSAFHTGTQRQTFHLVGATRKGTPVRYEFEQRAADALTGRVTNALHFTVGTGNKALRLRDAFTYDWRLWTIPELADACSESGFTHTEFHDFEGGALDDQARFHTRPLAHGEDLPTNWVVYLVANRSQA